MHTSGTFELRGLRLQVQEVCSMMPGGLRVRVRASGAYRLWSLGFRGIRVLKLITVAVWGLGFWDNIMGLCLP